MALLEAPMALPNLSKFPRSKMSSHAYALTAGIEVPALHEAFTEPGAGVRGMLDGRRVAVGQLHWVQASVGGALSSQGPSPWGGSFEASLAGQTLVYCGVEGQGVIGALAFSDTLRWALARRPATMKAPSLLF